MKPTFYHRVPNPMEGTQLHPLNQLEHRLPNVYRREVAKYKGREKLLSERIPILDCLWNDALHLSAVHPKTLAKAFLRAGNKKKGLWKFFVIDPNSLDTQNTVVFKYTKPLKDWRSDRSEYVRYRPLNFNSYSCVPARAIDYWKACLSERRQPLLFGYIPHILYKGTIDISDAPVIEV